jgi:hypothetical protein
VLAAVEERQLIGVQRVQDQLDADEGEMNARPYDRYTRRVSSPPSRKYS